MAYSWNNLEGNLPPYNGLSSIDNSNRSKGYNRHSYPFSYGLWTFLQVIPTWLHICQLVSRPEYLNHVSCLESVNLPWYRNPSKYGLIDHDKRQNHVQRVEWITKCDCEDANHFFPHVISWPLILCWTPKNSKIFLLVDVLQNIDKPFLTLIELQQRGISRECEKVRVRSRQPPKNSFFQRSRAAESSERRPSVICLAQTGQTHKDAQRWTFDQWDFLRSTLYLTVRFLSLSIRF